VRNPNTRRGKKTDQEGDAEKGEWRGAWWIGEQQGLMRKEKKGCGGTLGFGKKNGDRTQSNQQQFDAQAHKFNNANY